MFDFPTVRFSKFKAREFARIAGMTECLVLAWHENGHIGASRRGTAYPSHELAEAMLRHDLSRHGLSPSETTDIGYTCAGKILRLVMVNHPEACEVKGGSNAVAWMKQVHQECRLHAKILFGDDVGDELLVCIAGSEFQFMPSGTDQLKLPRYRSALVFNLEGYAEHLATMADKPIMSFQFECGPGEKKVRSTLAED